MKDIYVGKKVRAIFQRDRYLYEVVGRLKEFLPEKTIFTEVDSYDIFGGDVDASVEVPKFTDLDLRLKESELVSIFQEKDDR